MDSVLLVLLIGVAVLSILDVAEMCRYASSGSLPAFDAPYCSTLSSCIKEAFPVENSYAVEVGYAWLNINKIRKAWEEYISACEADPFSEEGIKDPFKKKIRKLKAEVYAALKNLVSATARANRAAVSHLSALADSLKRRGVEDSRDSAWLSFYSKVSMALKDMVDNTEKTTLGNYYNRVKNFKFSLIQVHVSPINILISSVAHVLPKEIKKLSVLSGIVGLSRSTSALEWAEELPKVADFVNISVGESSSVRKEMERLWLELDKLEKRTDREVKEIVEYVNKRVDEIYKVLDKYRGLDLNVLSGFLEKKVVFSPFGTSTSMVVEDTKTFIDGLVERLNEAVKRYNTGYRDLNAFGTLKEIKTVMDQVYNEVKRFDEVVTTAIDSCVTSIKSYKPKLKETEEAITIRLNVFKSATVSEKIELCGEMRNLIAVDGEEARAKELYERCVEEVKEGWKFVAECTGTYREKYLCCTEVLDSLRKEMKTSDAYQLYLKLRGELLKLYDSTDDTTKALIISILMKQPSNPNELEEVLEKMAKLLEKIPGVAETSWSGAVRSDAPSKVSLTISTIGSTKGRIKIPFNYIGYEVEGNLPVTVEKGYVIYNGEGSARIMFTVPPLPLENYVVDEENGVTVHYINTLPVPYILATEGNIMSVINGKEVNGIVMLRPGGEAIIKYTTIRIEPLGEDSFIIENVSDVPYSNIIEFPVVAEEVPHYCTALEDRVLCKINLKPGEKRIVKFKLKPEASETNTSPITRKVSKLNVSSDVDNVIRLLMKQLKRARELNREDIVPISFEGLDDIKNKEGVYPVLKSILDKLRTKAKVSLEKLRREDAERARIAEKFYKEEDFITPVVLAEENKGKKEENGLEFFAAVGGLGLIIYGLLGLRKKRIPDLRM